MATLLPLGIHPDMASLPLGLQRAWAVVLKLQAELSDGWLIFHNVAWQGRVGSTLRLGKLCTSKSLTARFVKMAPLFLDFLERNKVMDIGVYSIKSVSDQKIGALLDERKSFVLEDIGRLNLSEAVESIEKAIESKGLKCRVYTKGRSLIAGGASAVGIGIHNLATWNPDYEIAKNLATGSLTVTYKK